MDTQPKAKGGLITRVLNPCMIDVHSLLLEELSPSKVQIYFDYISKEATLISVFFNILEEQNIHNNITQNLKLATKNSFEIHRICGPEKKRRVHFKVPIDLGALRKMFSALPETMNHRHALVVRLEPQNNASGIVHFYYFTVLSQPKLLFHKLEEKKNSYAVLDIYGIEGLSNVQTVGEKYCSVCLSNPNTIVILPCRHMCICTECAESFNSQERSKNFKQWCPVCRTDIKSFILLA